VSSIGAGAPGSDDSIGDEVGSDASISSNNVSAAHPPQHLRDGSNSCVETVLLF
jgi:hypothetical protein